MIPVSVSVSHTSSFRVSSALGRQPNPETVVSSLYAYAYTCMGVIPQKSASQCLFMNVGISAASAQGHYRKIPLLGVLFGTSAAPAGHYTAAACRPETKIRWKHARCGSLEAKKKKKVKPDRSSFSLVCQGESVDRKGNGRYGSALGAIRRDEISQRLLQSRLLWATVRSLSALQSSDLREGEERKRSPRFRYIQQT